MEKLRIHDDEAKKSWRPDDEHFDDYPEESLNIDSTATSDNMVNYRKSLERNTRPNEELTIELVSEIQKGIEARNKLANSDLTEEEQDRLVDIAEKGLVARNRLVEGHLKLAIHLALLASGIRHSSYGSIRADTKSKHLSVDDYIQLSNIGLIRAAEKYDPSKGSKFTSYAGRYIEWEIMRARSGNTIPFRVPERSVKVFNTIENSIIKFEKENARPPTIEEISKMVHLPPAETEYIYTAMDDSQHISYEQLKELKDSQFAERSISDRTNPQEELTIEETLVDDRSGMKVEDEALEKPRRELLENILKENLTDRERQIIIMRFGLESGKVMTLSELGERFGVSSERARQLEQRALGKLKLKAGKILREVWEEDGRITWPSERPLSAIAEDGDSSYGVKNRVKLSRAEESMLSVKSREVKN